MVSNEKGQVTYTGTSSRNNVTYGLNGISNEQEHIGLKNSMVKCENINYSVGDKIKIEMKLMLLWMNEHLRIYQRYAGRTTKL